MTVLYEGRQIFFGRVSDAKRFFVDMGFVCPQRQTTSDFLTSLTNLDERIIRRGFERLVPQTPDDFVKAWKNSGVYRRLIRNIDVYDSRFPIGG